MHAAPARSISLSAAGNGVSAFCLYVRVNAHALFTCPTARTRILKKCERERECERERKTNQPVFVAV